MDWWQIERLLADLATDSGYHGHAIGRLKRLIDSKRFPKDQYPSLRRALFYARMRQAGNEVPGG